MADPKAFFNDPSEYKEIRGNGLFRPTDSQMRAASQPTGDNSIPQYQGLWTQHESANVPEDQNVRFWLTNLPQDCNVSMLLGNIRGFGRIYSCNILPPQYGNSGPPSCAASLAFFKLEAAQRFIQMCRSPRGFRVRNQRVYCVHHRQPVSPKIHISGSRCLVVKGSPDVVNEKSLSDYFRTKAEFSVDTVRYRLLSRYQNEIEFRFASFNGQASILFKALEVEQIPGIESFAYYPDPCQHIDIA